MDSKLFKRTYPYICNECYNFTHTDQKYCDKCGAENSLRKAQKEDYKNYHK